MIQFADWNNIACFGKCKQLINKPRGVNKCAPSATFAHHQKVFLVTEFRITVNTADRKVKTKQPVFGSKSMCSAVEFQKIRFDPIREWDGAQNKITECIRFGGIFEVFVLQLWLNYIVQYCAQLLHQ